MRGWWCGIIQRGSEGGGREWCGVIQRGSEGGGREWYGVIQRGSEGVVWCNTEREGRRG